MNWILYPLVRKAIIVLSLFFISFLFCINVKAQPSGPGPFNIFNPSDVIQASSSVADNDGNGQGIEVGLRFTVTQPGTVNSIRFFSRSTVSQTYTATLWNAGTMTSLTSGTATPAGLPVNNWVTVTVTPYHIIPGVTYVVSYLSPNGDYSVSTGIFTGADINAPTNGPPFVFTALASNAAFSYAGAAPATTPVFPATTAAAGANYWVDVSFTLDAPLPVSLTNLKATPDTKNIALSWQTASEQNNKGFTIQRSNNNTEWYNIGFVNGAGNSSSTINYSFIDKEPAPGKYFYRLQQTDLDNKTKASSIVMATLSGKGKTMLFQNNPNPVRTTTQIRFDLPDAQKVRLTLLDMTGREVQTLVNKTAEQGSHVITLNASLLSKQLYIIKLQTETETIIKRMVVQ